jgi:hypothetical protein
MMPQKKRGAPVKYYDPDDPHRKRTPVPPGKNHRSIDDGWLLYWLCCMKRYLTYLIFVFNFRRLA